MDLLSTPYLGSRISRKHMSRKTLCEASAQPTHVLPEYPIQLYECKIGKWKRGRQLETSTFRTYRLHISYPDRIGGQYIIYNQNVILSSCYNRVGLSKLKLAFCSANRTIWYQLNSPLVGQSIGKTSYPRAKRHLLANIIHETKFFYTDSKPASYWIGPRMECIIRFPVENLCTWIVLG